MRSLSVLVTGRVQGVGFRYFVLQEARNLKLTGWVRNTADYNVEVYAEGEEEKLMELLYILEEGPPMANVVSVSKSWGEARGIYLDFNVEY